MHTYLFNIVLDPRLWVFRNYFVALKDLIPVNPSCDAVYTWCISRIKRNRRQHVINGNMPMKSANIPSADRATLNLMDKKIADATEELGNIFGQKLAETQTATADLIRKARNKCSRK